MSSQPYLLGYDLAGVEKLVELEDVMHVAVFGYPGTGKSTFLLNLIVQHIKRDEGFMVVDPHGDLANNVLTHIPQSSLDKLIYIDPLTASTHGRVVKFNLMKVYEELEKSVAARMFMDSLSKIYYEYWGPRLDRILLSALDVVLEQPKARLSDLYTVLVDDEARESYLSNVRNPLTLCFWRKEFKKLPPDAVAAALTKVYRLIQEKPIARLFDCYESTVDLREAIDGGYWVVVNLAEGRCSSDVAAFIGSMLLAHAYFASISRRSTKPFYIYVDEAYKFATLSMQDILQGLRKYRVYMRMAAHYLEQYQEEIARAIPHLCDTVVCFRVGKNTAELLEPLYQPQVNKQILMSLPDYVCAVSYKACGKKTLPSHKLAHELQSIC